MPTYDYVCPNCGESFEIKHSIDDSPPSCPSCGVELRRKIKPIAFILKGKGWASKKDDKAI